MPEKERSEENQVTCLRLYIMKNNDIGIFRFIRLKGWGMVNACTTGQ